MKTRNKIHNDLIYPEFTPYINTKITKPDHVRVCFYIKLLVLVPYRMHCDKQYHLLSLRSMCTHLQLSPSNASCYYWKRDRCCGVFALYSDTGCVCILMVCACRYVVALGRNASFCITLLVSNWVICMMVQHYILLGFIFRQTSWDLQIFSMGLIWNYSFRETQKLSR